VRGEIAARLMQESNAGHGGAFRIPAPLGNWEEVTPCCNESAQCCTVDTTLGSFIDASESRPTSDQRSRFVSEVADSILRERSARR